MKWKIVIISGIFLIVSEKVHRRVDTNGDRELSSIFTKVEIYPRHDDSRAAYTCEAQHPALKAPLRASLVMSVLCKYLQITSISSLSHYLNYCTSRTIFVDVVNTCIIYYVR